MAVSQPHTYSYIQYSAERLAALRLSDVRFFALLGAIGVYGFMGAPTPDYLGAAEIIVAGLLLLSIGLSGFAGVVSNRGIADKPLWFQVGRITLIFLCMSAGAQFLFYGHEAGNAFRDIIALGFLGLPLLFYGLLAGRPERVKMLCGAVVMSGFLFAARSLTLFMDAPLLSLLHSDALAYLANSPSVLFCGIICGALAWQILTGEQGGIYKVYLPFLLLACGIVLLAVILTMQRASLGLMALSFIVIAAQSLKARPYRALGFILLLAAIMAALSPIIQDVWHALSYKNRTAGANMRIEDLKAIWAAIGDTPFSLLFGLGFGGSFESPAVGNYTVNFAHGLFSASLLKFGVIGTALILAYMASFAREIVKIPHKAMPFALALFAPFMICILLYASYKSLDFGLLLSLIAFSSVALSAGRRDFH